MSWIGVDIGGTKALAVRVEGGAVVERRRHPTGRHAGPGPILALLEDIVRGWPGASGVGVGFPGLVAHARGVVRSSVMLEGWRDVPLAAHVQARTGLPAVVENDVNAAALAEARQRGAGGALLYVAAGTGIGGALLDASGALWRGRGGFAGEIGNTIAVPDGARCWCGRRGCLNTVASGSAIEGALGLAPGGLAEASGPDVDRALAVAGDHLGRVLADIVQVLDPAVVAIGGGVVEAGPSFVAAARERVLAEVFPEIATGLVIERSVAGWTAGAVGAALLAADTFG